MNPRLGQVNKIVAWEKTVESRWLKNKSAPWLMVFAGDEIYFKTADGPVTAWAEVEKVEYIDDLTNKRAAKIIDEYGSEICLSQAPGGKKYCVLVWLKSARQIEPFKINKRGFGSAAGWLCVEDIEKVKT